MAQTVNNLPEMKETQAPPWVQKSLEKGTATNSIILMENSMDKGAGVLYSPLSIIIGSHPIHSKVYINMHI